MKRLFGILTIVLIGLFSCNSGEESDGTIAIIKTDMGDMKIKLYDETPKHRDNFVKLAKEKYFDGMLFHRVIRDFMIQTGDPNSKTATTDQPLGQGGPGYTLPPEFHDSLIHKKGAIAAARQDDRVNPGKESSGSQFYIVQGKVYQQPELQQLEGMLMQNKIRRKLFEYIQLEENIELRKKLDSLQNSGNTDEFRNLINQIQQEVVQKYGDSINVKFNNFQMNTYTTIGGVPHLDGEYTVFGEVVDGLAIVDSIAAQKVNKQDRPVKDIKIKSIEIIE